MLIVAIANLADYQGPSMTDLIAQTTKLLAACVQSASHCWVSMDSAKSEIRECTTSRRAVPLLALQWPWKKGIYGEERDKLHGMELVCGRSSATSTNMLRFTHTTCRCNNRGMYLPAMLPWIHQRSFGAAGTLWQSSPTQKGSRTPTRTAHAKTE